MTGKERILKAFSNTGEPDRVPFEPGIDFDSWPSLLNLDFWEYKEQGHTEITDLINYSDKLGFDLYHYGADIPEPNPVENSKISISESLRDDVKVVETTILTSCGEIYQHHGIPQNGPEYTHNKFIKDIDKDWPAFKQYFGENWSVNSRYFDEYKRVGNRGVVGVVVHSPIDFWQEYRHGGAEKMIYDCIDEKKIIEEFCQWYQVNSMIYLETVSKLEPKPDFVMIHGSSCSLSLISPAIFQTYCLPYIQKVSAYLKNSNILSLLHICGRSNELISMIANDTDVNVMDALEHPPAGNVDLAEIKKKFGSRLCLKGNVSAITMANGTPKQVREEAKKCIDAAAEGGGFMLAVGDSIGPNANLRNIEEFVKTALEYGKY